MIPATLPMHMATKGLIDRSAQVPTATPPARVAFWMRTCKEYTETEMMYVEQRRVLEMSD